ncbi:Peroxisomal hydratase-dehydrogenase-epimerase [Cyphellophora attinorum]|uniref:Peroxisomal hydratase-dehydrogenase-epimerase n=1 Tax=Cyphellophora attinorum TaxID=1664694 RepID=A0A0N1H6C0_9EURO|nr:Peroxisomal hydratase-dehydrogenase-epimerase [Phialophora attinorum]KPI36846.1 Peroxisomal hydratase-dehydrogenase-epimerase [Phialophora attinorum]
MGPTSDNGLAGRVAIITGAGGGLGRHYALFLASQGVKVIVNDYGGSLDGVKGTSARAEAVVNEIKAAGGEATANGSDISQQSEVKEVVAQAVEVYGRVDILVNNAGTSGQMSSHDAVNVESFRRTWEIACLGTVLLISAVWPIMEKQGYGRIVNTSSDSIYGFGGGGDGGYASSKGAVYALTRDLGRFSTKHGIKINGVLPSAVSRMSDLSPIIKDITHKYFKTEEVATFVGALASEHCPVSGELFSAGGGRAARTTLATFPGYNSSTVEGYLEHFDEVMGDAGDCFIPKDTLDQVSYAIKHATGTDVGKIEMDSAI